MSPVFLSVFWVKARFDACEGSLRPNAQLATALAMEHKRVSGAL